MKSFLGRGDWIRTSDLLLPKQARYQAAPLPELTALYLVHCAGTNVLSLFL